MNKRNYDEMARAVCRFDPAHDADRLHDAYVETESEQPAVLITRAKQRAIDERRNIKRRQPNFLAIRRQIPEVVDPANEAIKDDLIECVRAIVQTLPAEQQLLAQMYWWEELNPEEMSEKLARPRTTVYTQLRRLKERLASDHRLASFAAAFRLGDKQ